MELAVANLGQVGKDHRDLLEQVDLEVAVVQVGWVVDLEAGWEAD